MIRASKPEFDKQLKTAANQKRMKKLNISLNSMSMRQKLTAYLAATATVAVVTLAGSLWVGGATAMPQPGLISQDRQAVEWLQKIYDQAQVAELDQLAADFHGALSYGGNITNMMSLWTDDSSITLNGTAHVGKAAVQAFFQGSGYFLNNWVSLAPEYKTQIAIDGDTATITTQCVAIDLSASPMVVKSVIQVNATCEKVMGKWQFTSMNNTAPAPL
jgi:hypothetical protein